MFSHVVIGSAEGSHPVSDQQQLFQVVQPFIKKLRPLMFT